MNVKFTQTILPIVVFLSLVIKEGLSLNCYVCNSYADVRCKDPKGVKALEMTCDGNQTMCRKIEQHMKIDNIDEIRIHRQCATRGSLGDCLERTGTANFKSWYCQCKNKDLCNKAATTSVSFLMAGAAVLSVFFLKNLL